MNAQQEKKGYLWQIAVVILLAVVGVQSFLTYRVMNRDEQNQTESVERETLQLTPRSISSYDPSVTATSQSGQLVPPSIPKMNVNVSNLPGVKPSISAQQQQVQYPTHQLAPSSGMNMNISRNPFGMNIREEMAKMEEMMNAMMSRHGGASGRMRIPAGNISMGGRGSSPVLSVDNNNNYILQLNIPGLDKSEINAELNGRILTISGVQREETDSSGQSGRSYSSSYSSFHNSFSLPGPAKAEGITVEYKNNTVTVKVPKA